MGKASVTALAEARHLVSRRRVETQLLELLQNFEGLKGFIVAAGEDVCRADAVRLLCLEEGRVYLSFFSPVHVVFDVLVPVSSEEGVEQADEVLD